MTLLGRPDLGKNQNPIGPAGIVEGLRLFFEQAGASSWMKNSIFSIGSRIPCGIELPVLYEALERNVPHGNRTGAGRHHQGTGKCRQV